LLAPEAGEARRGAQLERAGALLAGDGEGAVIAGGRLVGGAAGRKEQLAVEACAATWASSSAALTPHSGQNFACDGLS